VEGLEEEANFEKLLILRLYYYAYITTLEKDLETYYCIYLGGFWLILSYLELIA
jgi:hypothetical protein